MSFGEVFLAAFFSMLLTRLTSPEFLKFVRREGYSKKLKRWRNTLLMLQGVLNDAEVKQLTDRSVRTWLDDLRNLAYDVEDIFDEFDTEMLRRKLIGDRAGTSQLRNLVTAGLIVLSPGALKYNVRMASRVKEITRRFQDVSEHVARLGLQSVSEGLSRYVEQRKPSVCLPNQHGIYGRDAGKRKTLEKVLRDEASSDCNFQVISIVGMAGVGKTTLSQLVCTDKAVYDFNPRVWVCVSVEFDVMRIAKAILESITFQPCELTEFNQVQVKLREALARKKFLLVLDDVWNRNYGLWEALKSSFAAGAPGSKIIVTTRCVEVALMMGPVEYHELELLSDDDCWLVFMQHAFENRVIGEHPNLELIQMKVLEKCRGLPLAARALGGLLRSKQRDEWENILSRRIWNLPHETDILPALRLSYHHFPSYLKRCFAYCAVIPKGYQFGEEELVLLWMAEGLIQQHHDGRPMEDLGIEYFRELVSSSIFQVSSSNTSLYVMHDLVNDLAQWAAGETCFSLQDELEASEHRERLKGVRHASYIRKDYVGIKKFEALHAAKCCRTFLSFRQGDAISFVTTNVLGLLKELKRLRVLSLSCNYITELPRFFAEMKHLRYLNLSSTMIRTLPESTSSLYNLQTLKLRDCALLMRLPKQVETLINLCHFDITNVHLVSSMPLGINKLRRLRKLSDFFVSKRAGCGIEELMSLNLLRGTLCISRLENVVDGQRARQANLSAKKDLDALVLKWSCYFNDSRNRRSEKDVLDMLQPHRGLKELTISCYGGTEFPAWVADRSFSNIVFLRLENCENCSSLPPLGQLESLKDLIIIGMGELKSIGSELYGVSSSNPFLSLETLHFEQMAEWKDWQACQKDVEIFPWLRKLSIISCPALLGKLPNHLPSLEKLVIRECKHLSVSVSNFPMLRKLDINGCKEIVCRSTEEFSSLKSVVLSRVSKVSCLTDGFLHGFRKTETLEIVGIEQLTTLWQNETGSLQQFSSLRCLNIKSCSGLVSLGAEPEREEGPVQLGLPWSLEILRLNDCESLERLMAIKNFSSLRELHIEKCMRLVSVAETILPSTLKKLWISYCDNLVCLFEQGKDSEISPASSLEYLYVRSCPYLGCLSSRGKLPAPLKHLELWDCPELHSIAETFNLYLEHIEIRYCRNLTSLPGGLNNLSHLREISMYKCPSLVSFPEGGLPTTNLQKLSISWCGRLEALPIGMPNLSSLLELDIHTCPSIVTFPEGGFPTNLTSLSVTKLNICRPLFDWGLHRFASLKRLFIAGGCPFVMSFPQVEMGMMLPISLTSLHIVDFPNLEYLSCRGFQNLNFLEELWISYCPKLKSLPGKGFPASLLQLYIRGCPLLKEKCKRDTGQEFFKIANIPCVYIDNKFIYDQEEEEFI